MESALAACRESLAQAERDRDAAQGRIQGAHREHADLLGQLEGERARAQESTVRRERLEEEAAEVRREAGLAQDAWHGPVRSWIAAWWRWTRSIRAASVSRPSAKNAARRCRPARARFRRRRSRVATC
jgi:hypothetical protein